VATAALRLKRVKDVMRLPSVEENLHSMSQASYNLIMKGTYGKRLSQVYPFREKNIYTKFMLKATRHPGEPAQEIA
jgi:hypothetical protein